MKLDLFSKEVVNGTTEYFSELIGMEVITFKSPITGHKYIDGPVNKDDYCKYYEWLRKETNQYRMSRSENLEDFKKEFLTDPGIFLPIIFNENDLTVIAESVSEDDLNDYNNNFNSFFNVYKNYNNIEKEYLL